MNNPVYDYADDNPTRIIFEPERDGLGDINDKSEVLYHSVGPSTSQIAEYINEADTLGPASGARYGNIDDSGRVSSVALKECHYEMENVKVS